MDWIGIKIEEQNRRLDRKVEEEVEDYNNTEEPFAEQLVSLISIYLPQAIKHISN